MNKRTNAIIALAFVAVLLVLACGSVLSRAVEFFHQLNSEGAGF